MVAGSSHRPQRGESRAWCWATAGHCRFPSSAAAKAGPSTCAPGSRRFGSGASAATSSPRSRRWYAYVDAQREYAAQDRNGNGVLEYARRFLSQPGQQDGLYWSTPDGEPASPAGPLFDTRDIKDGYYGYRFKILEAQGPAASGGARSYLTRDKLTNGFAMVAWPAHYGETGVMSFLVNHDGVVYQTNLGTASASVAGAMTRFDPDSTWVALPPP